MKYIHIKKLVLLSVPVFMLFIIACGPIFQEYDNVEVTQGKSLDEKKIIAERLIGQVRDNGILNMVKERFPDLTETELYQFQIFTHIATVTMNDQSRSTVYVACSFHYNKPFGPGKSIVALCKQQVEAAMKQQDHK